MKKPILAITMGDPGGIGPEVILRALEAPSFHEGVCPLIVGVRSAFEKAAASAGLPFLAHDAGSDFNLLPDESPCFLDVSSQAAVLLASTGCEETGKGLTPDAGRVSAKNAAMAMASLVAAADLACRGKVQGIATAPVNKTAMRLLRPEFSGHTEYLARTAGTQRFAMMFVSSRLKVTLVTVHVPIKKVSGLLTEDLIHEKIELTDQFFKRYLKVDQPRLAVCALNPHGEEMGTEERAVIAPAVERARRTGIEVTGPFSADQLFYEAYSGRYDGLISMYHDQALGPFKMIAFHDGVNVTLGLPFVRTSPDHGTAFDIAYQNKAHPASMKASIQLARDLMLADVSVP